MMKKIAFDIDNTILDFSELAKRVLDIDGIKIIPSDNYKIKTDPPISVMEWWRYVERIHELWYMSKPVPGAVELIRKTHAFSGVIKFVTKRQWKSAGYTHLAIQKIIGPEIPFEIAFVPPGGVKSTYLNGFHCYVEDRRKYAKELAEAGIEVFLLKTEYNHIEGHSKINIINHLDELTENLLAIL